MTGLSQSFKGAIPPQGEARPAWKVFRVLATLCQAPNITYHDSQEVLQALQQLPMPATLQPDLVNELKNTWAISPLAPLAEGEFYRLTQWPLYRVDALVRRASSLQASGSALKLGIYLNENMLKKLAFTEGETICIRQSGVGHLPVYVNNQLPDTLALVPAGFTETSGLGSNTAKLLLMKI